MTRDSVRRTSDLVQVPIWEIAIDLLHRRIWPVELACCRHGFKIDSPGAQAVNL